MDEEKKAINAAQEILDYCASHVGCANCVFDLPGRNCMFTQRADNGEVVAPCEWLIPKPCRFTDADKNLAEALKAFGCIAIEKGGTPVYCRAVFIDFEGEDDCRIMPDGAFSCLECGERVPIDDIIKEGENND